jgi:pilus assembly protein CpaB
MKPKTMILMVVAVGCGLVASYMTSRLIAERNTPAPEPDPKVKVLVAKKKLQQMTLIGKPEDLFVEKELPPDAVPKKAITTFEALKGKRLNKVINEETFVTTDDLVNKDLDGLQAVLPEGMRAMAIRVNPESLVGGFVLPGSKVDIVATTREGETQAQLIMQDMLVLAVDANDTRDPERGRNMMGSTATLAVTPEQATRLRVASQLGELSLLLRGMGDNKTVRIRSSKRDDLGKPFQQSIDFDAALANGLMPPSIPDLPPVPQAPTGPAVVAADPEAVPVESKPVKEHVMTIITGEFQTKSRFTWDPVEGWKSNVNKSPDQPEERPARLPAKTPAAPPPSKPDAQQTAPAAPAAPAAPVNPVKGPTADYLQKNSGLAPVNSSK